MRPYPSFPRATRCSSPRILFYASDAPGELRRDLALATLLAEELPTGSVVLATSAVEGAGRPPVSRIEVVDLPRMTPQSASLPLARARVRQLRKRRLATLFDVFQPDLVLLELSGSEAEIEAQVLLERARALGAASLMVVGHEPAGQACLAESELATVCASCRERMRAAVRGALAELERARKQT